CRLGTGSAGMVRVVSPLSLAVSFEGWLDAVVAGCWRSPATGGVVDSAGGGGGTWTRACLWLAQPLSKASERSPMLASIRKRTLRFLRLVGIFVLIHEIREAPQLFGGDAERLGRLVANGRNYFPVQIGDQVGAFFLQTLGGVRNLSVDASRGLLHAAIEVAHKTPQNCGANRPC